MSDEQQRLAGEIADKLIAKEVSIQDAMWGDANERADSTRNQLIVAGSAQIVVAMGKIAGVSGDDAVAFAKPYYPSDWNGLRDYGSNVANLVVAAAFIRSEIKRRILLGEDITRTKRGEAYKGPDMPYVSSAEVIAGRSE